MKQLKKIPFFLFLLPLFFCLHGSVENYGFLEPGEVVLIGAVILIGIALFFGLLFLFTRNYMMASLITFFVGLWYLFFGAMHDWVKSHAFLSFMGSYSVLLPLLFVLTLLWIILIKRNKPIALKLFFYLNILLLIYCVLDSALLLNKRFSPQKKLANTVAFDYSKVTSKPNLYYLVFDEYPGYTSLKDSFGFANDSLYNFLQKKHFSMLPLFSNYDFTLFSTSAMLNMQYVYPDYNPKKVSQRDLQLRVNEIRNGEVFNIFKKMGYRIQNYSIFDVGELHGVNDQNAFLPVHSLLLTDKILHNRIIRTSGWLFQTGKLSLPSWRKKYLYQHERNSLYSQKMLITSANEKGGSPKFCYAHFMMPHWPYYRDSTGAYYPDEIIAKSNLLNNRPMFLSYVKYTNTVIESLVEHITVKDPGAIVVIMSDHGFRYYKNTAPLEPFNFNNICAVRFPGNSPAGYKEKWSAVNIFRYLFNTQYGQQLPYQKDSSILLSY
ncbi:MAG: sulfatase-like hydrolase/transferase [Ferruginibacter sp.]